MADKRRPTSSTIEQDFLSATDRLITGKPRNAALRQLAARGKLEINYSTVAKEAGRSRTLIAFENCAYPSVRRRIQLLMAPIQKRMSLTAIVFELRSKLREQDKMLKAQQHQMANHLIARRAAEKETENLKSELNRKTKIVPIANGPSD